MKRSEKILLAAFAALFLVIIGGSFGKHAFTTYRKVTDETARLKSTMSNMATTIAQGSDWQKRSDWLEAHVPKFASHEEASTVLFDVLQKEASTTGLKIATREMIAPRIPQDGESLGYFDKASVKLTFADVKEEDLFKWMHTLYGLQKFIGFTRMQITANQGRTVGCEVEVTQFYREAPAQKLSRAH